MIGVAFALCSALAFATGAVLVRRRLRESSIVYAGFVLTAVGNFVLWPLAFAFTSSANFNLEAILFFAAAGMLVHGVNRILYFKGMDVIGASLNASLFATYPVFSSILAVFLLGEAFVAKNWIGIICVVAGAVCLERGVDSSNVDADFRGIRRKGLIFPLLAGLAVAFSFIFRKRALDIWGKPLLGAAIAELSALLFFVMLLTLPCTSVEGSLLSSRDFRLFWKAGVIYSAGWVFSFYALNVESVSAVTALIQTEPLFVLLLAHLFLKGLERVSLRLAAGTILIVAGVVFISVA